jgi:hypothetical protein
VPPVDIIPSTSALLAHSSRKEKPNSRDSSWNISEASARRRPWPSCSYNRGTSLAESIISAAWDCGDPAVEDDEESDPSDEGFRLDIAESSDDEAIPEMREENPEDCDEEEEDNE